MGGGGNGGESRWGWRVEWFGAEVGVGCFLRV